MSGLICHQCKQPRSASEVATISSMPPTYRQIAQNAPCDVCKAKNEQAYHEEEKKRVAAMLLGDLERLGLWCCPKEKYTCDRALIGPNMDVWRKAAKWEYKQGTTWIWGVTNGVGKSQLARYLAWRQFEQHGRSIGVAQASKIDSKANDWGWDIWRRVCERVDLLVIDDVVNVPWRSVGVVRLFELLEARYEAKLPNIVTSNLRVRESMNMVARAVPDKPTLPNSALDRLGKVEEWQMKGESLRGRV